MAWTRTYNRKRDQQPPMAIPEVDWINRTTSLVEGLRGKGRVTQQSIIDEMFELYNDRFLPRENGKHCGGCRGRVITKLRQHYETVIKKSSDPTGEALQDGFFS